MGAWGSALEVIRMNTFFPGGSHQGDPGSMTNDDHDDDADDDDDDDDDDADDDADDTADDADDEDESRDLLFKRFHSCLHICMVYSSVAVQLHNQVQPVFMHVRRCVCSSCAVTELCCTACHCYTNI